MAIGTLPMGECQSFMRGPKIVPAQYLSGYCNFSFKWVGKSVDDYLNSGVLLRERSGINVETSKTLV
jgi:hypothetical protein